MSDLQSVIDTAAAQRNAAQTYIEVLLRQLEQYQADFDVIFGCVAGAGSAITEDEALRQISLLQGVQEAAVRCLGPQDLTFP